MKLLQELWPLFKINGQACGWGTLLHVYKHDMGIGEQSDLGRFACFSIAWMGLYRSGSRNYYADVNTDETSKPAEATSGVPRGSCSPRTDVVLFNIIQLLTSMSWT